MFVSPDMDISVPEPTPLYDGRMTKVLSPVVIQENRRAGKLEPQRNTDNTAESLSPQGLAADSLAHTTPLNV
jgi:hypothetical protein